MGGQALAQIYSDIIRHTYDADGRLAIKSYGTLEWVTVDMGFTSFTRQEYRESRRVDYLGELTLEDGKVYRRLHEAGWTDGEGREVAAVRDWRGSLRATWTDTGEGGEKVFGNLTGYYPYGLPWADWQGSERWLYGGKELEREHGLWTYDFHAREQDPSLGRFRAPDPLAASNPGTNPYAFCSSDPVNRIDPIGKTDFFNTKGEYLCYVDDGYDVAAMTVGKRHKKETLEEFGRRAYASGEYIVASDKMITQVNEAFKRTDASGLEQMFLVFRDGGVSDIDTGEPGRVKINLDEMSSQYLYDVHSHPNTKNKIGLPRPSELDKETSGNQVNIVLGYKENGIYNPNTIGASQQVEREERIGFYNKEGEIKGSGMERRQFERTINSILGKQQEISIEREKQE